MKTKTLTRVLAVVTAFALMGICRAQTSFLIETPGSQFAFTLDGTNVMDTEPYPNDSPALSLRAGATYTLNINTTPGYHPVNITTEPDFPYTDGAFDGASPQNVTSEAITLTIPATNYPATLYYICGFHGFYGVITVLPPEAAPAPPRNTILSIVLTPTSVTLTSTGTNTTYNLVPEYNSNLATGTWLSVPVFTNNFVNGTNTTSFGRLEPICGPNVFLRISQRPPQ